MTKKMMLASVLAAVGLSALPDIAAAQTVQEQAAEHRFQLDFHVNDAALAKMLPQGWEAVIATQGAAKDANLRMIFIDRMAIMGPDGKPAARPTARLVYLGNSRQADGGRRAGQMIIHGLTECG